MADEVEHLVIAPFREIVEKANNAIDNAKDADDDVSALMLRAAQSLLKEGERALKRIEPICNKNRDEYGANFVDAIKEHDDIAQYRSELEDLLWDFDDYVEADGFDGDQFDKLQKASRKSAPRILDIVKRMKLVAPAPKPLRPFTAAFPRQSVSPPREPADVLICPPSSSERTMNEVEQQLGDMMGAQAGPDTGLDEMPRPTNVVDRSNSNRSANSESTSEEPPRPPSANPEDIRNSPAVNPGIRSDETIPMEHRPLLSASNSPTLPLANPLVSQGNETNRQHSPGVPKSSIHNGPDSILGQVNRVRTDSHLSASNSNENFRNSGQSYDHVLNGLTRQSRPSSNASSLNLAHSSISIPEDSAVSAQTHAKNFIGPMSYPRRQTSISNTRNPSHTGRHTSTDSFSSSIFDTVLYDGASSPVNSTHRSSNISIPPGSPYSPGSQPPSYSPHPPVYQSHSVPSSFSDGTIVNHSAATLTSAPQGQPGIELLMTPPTQRIDDAGLIPVDSETTEEPIMPSRQQDCCIGPYSSFYQMKGFCRGAEEAMKGELGFKKIKRPVGGFSMAVVAKCNHCLFELDYKSVEQDLKEDSSGNLTSNGIGFRLRILQKSHLAIRCVDEQLYGCIFCIRAGQTIEESDATVFFSQKQLFAHMTRHSRPLPSVPGLTIIQGDEIAAENNNFDLWFSTRPVQSIMAGLAREIGKLPSAVAIETRKNAFGILRTPPDRGAVLQFAVGAKIVGIEFPARYEGKWGIGWHDGVRAAFEADSVRLDAPPRNEVRMQGTSNMQAKARWKWNQSGEGNWLRFSKGDTIRNISWAYTDHWCWSGISSKGWGIFPQSHIEPNSIKSIQPSDESSVNSVEKPKGGGLSWLTRKNTDRKSGWFNDSGPRMHIY